MHPASLMSSSWAAAMRSPVLRMTGYGSAASSKQGNGNSDVKGDGRSGRPLFFLDLFGLMD
jgi:hypothetical protein